MSFTVPGVLLTGNHAGRPAANASGLGKGSLYACSTHSLIYQTDGSSWSTWATLGTTPTDPQYTTIELGHASDTTLARASAGNITVEGNAIYRAGGTDVPITDGGTGASTKAAAFDALSPMTTSGDIIYGGASGTGTRLAKGTDGQVLTLASGVPSWASGGGGGGDLTRLAETVLGADAADITFTGISNAYRDLIIVAQCRGTNGGNDWSQLAMRMGDGSIDTGNNYGYSWTQWGSGASSAQNTSGVSNGLVSNMPSSSSTAGAFSATNIELLGYASTSRFKTWTGIGSGFGASDNYSWAVAGVYRSTSAEVDQLRFYCPTGDLKTGSRIAIYGRA